MANITRFFKKNDSTYFIFGLRGTGKSTWLKQQYPHSVLINLLEPENLRAYSAFPERLKQVVYATKENPIIIDEIEKSPELLSVIHSLIEEKQGWQFILTGSSTRKLRRAGVNLLGGRALVRHMHPFMAAELGENFKLKPALKLGLVPIVVGSLNPIDTLNTYIGIYLREEVLQESLVRNIGNFSRFLEIASFSHANVLNISNIACECQLSRKLVEGYLNILEDLLLCTFLPVFTKRAKRKTISHRKFYYFDAGVFRHLSHQGPLDKPEETSGAALEGLVMQHLRAWNDYQNSPYQLSYWRTRSGVEVDFIIYGPKGFWALEVKNGKNISPNDLKGLKIFKEDHPEATSILLYRGHEKLKRDGILCIPVEEFLKQLHPENLLLSDSYN